MSKRKSRKELSKKVDITKPLLPVDITKWGTDDDPCFGKLFDLTEDPCKRCGDSNLCLIVFNQGTLKLRAEEEDNGRFKDLELDAPKKEVDTKEIKKFIKAKIAKGTITILIKKQVIKKFGISKEEATKLIKKYKE